ncbi:MAG: ELWxxDGT repeat protein [Steroidobacteraceae bacterium]
MTRITTGLARLAAAAIAIAITMGLAQTASAGTVSLLKDLDTNEVISSTYPWFLGVAGQRAIFAGNVPGVQGQRLFRTDGTAAGTVKFAAQNLVDPRAVGSVSGRLLIAAYTNASHAETQLWATDGTDAGTTMIRAIGSGERSIGSLGANATRLYFCAGTGSFSGCDPYVTDGTAAGTVRLSTDRSAMGRGALTASGGMYFFSGAVTGGDFGLWFTDGTPAGTHALHSFAVLGFDAIGGIAWSDTNNLYVNADTANQRGLYRVNVDTGATVELAPNGYSSFAENALELGGARFFIMDDILWRSDGTPSGTIQLIPSPPLPYAARNPLVRVGNRMVFVNSDETHGAELWASDGTVPGTVRLVDATPGPDGNAQILTATADRVFFVAGPEDNQRFWVSDGTPAGTRVIPQRGGGAYALDGYDFFNGSAVAGDRVFLTVIENADGGFVQHRRLWSTDLTGTDVLKLSMGGTQAQVLGNRVLFANMSDPLGTEPWVSDGTVAGTSRILDLAISGQTEHSSPLWFTIAGTRAFFDATDRDHGRELWTTDGTSAGTRRVSDINPGAGHSAPSNLLAIDGNVYFNAGLTFNNSERRLWRSDGTEAGTIPLGDISAQESSCGPWAAKMNGRIWFFGATPPSSAVDIWSTDDTAAGTRFEFQLPDEIRYLPACHLLPSAKGLVFTSGYTATAGTLWRTDGTEAGTLRLGDITPAGAGAGGPQNEALFAAVGGLVYLLADDPAGSGRELWRTDGTVAGTTVVADLTAGSEGAQNFAIREFGTSAIFSYHSAIGSADGLYRISAANVPPERIKAGNTGTQLPATATQVFFKFDDAGTGSLWATDGTVTGTRAIFNAPAGSTLPVNSMHAGDKFLFLNGPLDASGQQIWMTNGQPNVMHRLSNLTSLFLNDDWRVLNDRPIFAFEDGVHGSEPWMVVNQPPVAVADSAVTPQNVSLVVLPRGNDSDPDSAAAIVTMAVIVQPAHGTLAVEGAGYRYTPTSGFAGVDTFDYQLTDEFGAQSAVARVTITVNAPPSSGGSSGGGSGGGGGGGGALEWLTLAMLAAAVWRKRAN